jgi:uncharacterized protein (UPF0335 family)
MAERMSASTRAGANRPGKAEYLATAREIIELQQDRDSAHSAVMARFKAAKKAGFNTKALKDAIASREQDAAVVASEMSDRIEYLHYMGIKVPGFQPDLFAGGERPTADGLSEKEREDEALWTAKQAGYATGRAGGGRGDNPHLQGSQHYVEWDKGYQRGQEHIAREMGPDARKPNTEKKADTPKAGGRRAKAGNPEDGPPPEGEEQNAPATTDGGSVH